MADAANPPDRNGPEDEGQRRLVRAGVIFIVAVAVAFVVWLVVTGRAGEFVSVLAAADPVWVVAGAACFAAFFLLDMLCFRVAGMLTGSRMGFLDLTGVAAAGIVFGYLTPGQMGAAPAQIVRLAQVGLKVGDASAVQLTKFFIYQAAVTVLGAVVLVARFSYFESMFGQVVLVSVLSFAVHIAIMAGLVAVIFFPDLVRRFSRWAVGVLGRRTPFIKDPDAVLASVEAEVDSYAGAVHSAVRNVPVVGGAIVITIVQLAFYYCIPFCVLRALGVDDADFVNCLCSAAFVQLIMTAVPLPGGTGGAEGGFVLFYGGMLGAKSAAGVVLWRLLSFYGPVLATVPLLGVRSKAKPSGRPKGRGRRDVGAGDSGVREPATDETSPSPGPSPANPADAPSA